jgi:hypothetical protein
MIATIETCRSTLMMFLNVRKYGDRIDARITSNMRPIKGGSMIDSLKIDRFIFVFWLSAGSFITASQFRLSMTVFRIKKPGGAVVFCVKTHSASG